MGNKTENILIRLTGSEKELIQERAKELGFKTMTSFIKVSTKDFFE